MSENAKRNKHIMRLRDAQCKNCYKCVRLCPVNAISLTEDQATIEEDRCIFCGKCYIVCPQDARENIGDLELVKSMIAADEKVYISLASNFSVYFDSISLKKMGAVLKKLGAVRVEETAVGANRVIAEYTEIIKKHEDKNLLSSLCPSINFLVQKYYPDMVKWLCPVDTPLEAHAKMMRAVYGDDIKVVGIGPCIAVQELRNMTDDGNLIDAYITYEELEAWMAEAGVEIGEEDAETFPVSDYRGRYLDEEGGVFRALPAEIKYEYRLWEVSGASRTEAMIKGMDVEKADNCFVVASACANHCLGGPIIKLAKKDTFSSMDRWLKSIKEGDEHAGVNPSESAVVDGRKTFQPLPVELPEPNADELKYFLSIIGRNTKEQMLDCGGCGYNSCIEKAKAVFQGMADPFMCIPHSRDRAETTSNLIFDNSPSGVVVMDMNFTIKEINPVAMNIMNMSAEEAVGQNMTMFIDGDLLKRASLKEVKSVRERTFSEPLNKLLDLTYFKVTGHNLCMLVMDDRTEMAAKIKEGQALRKQTLEVTQNVVEKQMRIAQEIASLLGETTAETKLALNRLKNTLILDENSGWD